MVIDWCFRRQNIIKMMEKVGFSNVKTQKSLPLDPRRWGYNSDMAKWCDDSVYTIFTAEKLPHKKVHYVTTPSTTKDTTTSRLVESLKTQGFKVSETITGAPAKELKDQYSNVLANHFEDENDRIIALNWVVHLLNLKLALFDSDIIVVDQDAITDRTVKSTLDLARYLGKPIIGCGPK